MFGLTLAAYDASALGRPVIPYVRTYKLSKLVEPNIDRRSQYCFVYRLGPVTGSVTVTRLLAVVRIRSTCYVLVQLVVAESVHKASIFL